MPLVRNRCWDSPALVHGVVTLALVLLLILSGCAKSADQAAAPTGSAATTASSGGDGKAIFDKTGCARCHSIGAGGGSRSGPDLTHVGADPSHTADWLAAKIKNPRASNPNSRMPSFEGRISDADLKTLSEYLAAQK
jgi:mono/diheme cytochrome c family protein